MARSLVVACASCLLLALVPVARATGDRATRAAAPATRHGDDFVCLADLVAAPAAHEPRAAVGAAGASGAGDDGSLVDVMFITTPAATAAAGGAAAMAAQLDGHVAYTNAAYLASDVAQRVRQVHAAEFAYVTSGSIITDLARLKDPSDGFLDGVHALRDEHAADLVCLVVSSASAGTAYQMQTLSPSFEDSAFAVIAANVSGEVFAHEAGHIMGLGHDNVPGAVAVFCYAFGHKTAGPEVYRTIMAGPPGIKVDVFSNPDLQIAGQALGIDGAGCPPGAADSARALDETALTVANFRGSADGGNALLDAGGALGGALGEPELAGQSTRVPGFAGQIAPSGAAPSAPAVYFLASASTPVPFKTGTLVAFPFLATLAVTTSPAGTSLLAWATFPELPPGTPISIQVAIADAGAPAGVALSNAVAGVTL
jgi:hypothetical protein